MAYSGGHEDQRCDISVDLGCLVSLFRSCMSRSSGLAWLKDQAGRSKTLTQPSMVDCIKQTELSAWLLGP